MVLARQAGEQRGEVGGRAPGNRFQAKSGIGGNAEEIGNVNIS